MRHLSITLLCNWILIFPAISQEEDAPFDYRAGYDPAVEKRAGIGNLPDAAWGEEKRGLQLALAVPDKLKMNERVALYLVVRNTSEGSIRFSAAQPFGGLGVGFGGLITYGINPTWDRQDYHHHHLEPGHQCLVLADHLQIVGKGKLIPTGALMHPEPGSVTVSAYFNTAAPVERLPDGTKREARRGPDEWTGSLRAPKRQLELVAEEAPFTIVAPPELPENHGLPYALDIPGGFGGSAHHMVSVHPKRILHLHKTKDAHWLNDFGTYRGHVYWGPMTAEQLARFGFIDLVRKAYHARLERPISTKGPAISLGVLIKSEKPLAALGLELAMRRELGPFAEQPRNDELDRLIREQRIRLYPMGLQKEVRAVLDDLSKNDPPLPDRSVFHVVHQLTVLPEGLTEEGWGPEIDGLRAATLMPKIIKSRELVNARLFIRNVSEEEIFMTVSDQGGYDHATATDLQMRPLSVQRPCVYPTGIIANFAAPEYNPVDRGGKDSLTTLTKVLLKPGAVWEVKTDSSLGYNLKNHPPLEPGPRRGITDLRSKPTEALVTWHLHTANGAEFSKGGKQRTWPTRGSWSGTLETAPVRVSLRAAD